MAIQKAVNINIQDTENKDDLALVLDGVLENIQVRATSEAIKNKMGSGDPKGGTVQYKRLVNATLNNLGTARSNGATAIENANVNVNIDTDKEIVEELAGKDIKLYGVTELAARRAENQAKRVAAFLDTQFYAEAKTSGTEFITELTDKKQIIDALIDDVKGTSSDFVDGVDAEDIVVVCDPAYRRAIKNYLDNATVGTDGKTALIGTYDGVEVYESNRLPQNIHVVCMAKGAIAQPYYVEEYNFEKIPLADAFAVETFLHVGTKAVMPETIKYYEDGISA